ncbi:hypothetical protein Csa_022814, partial [Cucumis sativus]
MRERAGWWTGDMQMNREQQDAGWRGWALNRKDEEKRGFETEGAPLGEWSGKGR